MSSLLIINYIIVDEEALKTLDFYVKTCLWKYWEIISKKKIVFSKRIFLKQILLKLTNNYSKLLNIYYYWQNKWRFHFIIIFIILFFYHSVFGFQTFDRRQEKYQITIKVLIRIFILHHYYKKHKNSLLISSPYIKPSSIEESLFSTVSKHEFLPNVRNLMLCIHYTRG